MELERDDAPGPNLAEELSNAGMESRVLWYPNPEGAPGGTVLLPDVGDGHVEAVTALLDAHVPVVVPGPPSFEERLAALEARVTALEGAG